MAFPISRAARRVAYDGFMPETRHAIDGALKRSYLAYLAAASRRALSRRVVVEINARRLEDVETSLGLSFDPRALLLFGEHGFPLADAVRLKPSAAKAGVPKALVVLGCEEHVWTCLRAKTEAEEPTIVLFLDDDRSEEPMPLHRWFDREREAFTDGPILPPPPYVDETLEVVVRRADTAPVVAAYRVTHPKFGEGSVVAEEGSGESHKLEIDFGANGKKKLLARFVTRIE